MWWVRVEVVVACVVAVTQPAPPPTGLYTYHIGGDIVPVSDVFPGVNLHHALRRPGGAGQ